MTIPYYIDLHEERYMYMYMNKIYKKYINYDNNSLIQVLQTIRNTYISNEMTEPDGFRELY